jgi:hypothetical protein
LRIVAPRTLIKAVWEDVYLSRVVRIWMSYSGISQ